MIRFIKNILDIKNLLGMQRVVPPTPIVDPQVYLTPSASNTFIATFTTGELIVQYLSGGVVIEERYDTSYSGQPITVSPDFNSFGVNIINTDDRLTIDTIEILSGTHAVSIGNNVLNVRIPESIETLDAENAWLLETITNTDANYGMDSLRAYAETTDQRDAYIGVINNNVAPYGLTPSLYIDANETYAADVITAATAQGWYIYT